MLYRSNLSWHINFLLDRFFSSVIYQICDIAEFVFNFTKALCLLPLAKIGFEKARICISKIIINNIWKTYSIILKKIIGNDVLMGWLSKASAKGNPRAWILLGKVYENEERDVEWPLWPDIDDLSEEERDIAIAVFEEKSEKIAEEVDNKLNLAFESFKQAADLNYGLGQFHCYKMLDLYSRSIKNSKIDAETYLRMAAENGYSVAQYEWGQKLLAEDKFTEAIPFIKAASKKINEAKKWIKKFSNIEEIEKKALAGDGEAMYQFSKYFWEGAPKGNSLRLAHFWNTKAAKAGYPLAMAYEGVFIIHNWVTGTLEDSFNYYQKAVDAGCKIAHEGLGECYLYGWGVEQDYEKAKYHFKKVRQGYRLKGITAKNIKEKVDGKKALENDRDFHN